MPKKINSEVRQKKTLKDLLIEIEKTDIKRYRLGSLNPLELTEEILESTDTTLVRMIGNVIILYKPTENEENQKYAKQLAKLNK